MTSVWYELRLIGRSLRSAPTPAACIVLSVATGLCAVATMLGVLDGLFLRAPSGVRDSKRVVAVGKWVHHENASYPAYRDLSESGLAFAQVGAFATMDYTVRIAGEATPVRGMLASASLLPLLGTSLRHGRAFTADEDRPGEQPVALVAEAFALTHYASVPAAIGQHVLIGGKVFDVIGVLPAGFTAPDLAPVDMVLPLTNTPWFGGERALGSPDYRWLRIVGRLRPDVTPARASAEVSLLYQRHAGERAADAQRAQPPEMIPVTSLVEARRDPAAPTSRVALWVSLLAMAVLLVACLNAVALEMVRAVRRKRTLAIQTALGVPRRVMEARAVAEALILAGVAFAIALPATRLAWRVVVNPALQVGNASPIMTARLLAVCGGIALGAACLLAIPQLRLVRGRNPREELANGTASMSRAMRGVFRTLLTAQMALAVLLVSEAGIFVMSLRNATSVSLGITPEHLLIASVDLRAAGLDTSEASLVTERLLERVRGMAGVGAAGMTNSTASPGFVTYPVTVPGGDSSRAAGDEPLPSVNAITPGYLEAIGARIVNGRALGEADLKAPVVLVSARFAKRYWNDAPPIGRCVQIGDAAAPCGSVIGVVSDRRETLTDAMGAAEVYVPYESPLLPAPIRGTFLGRELAVRVADEPQRTAAAIQDAILTAVPTLTAVRVRTGADYVSPQYRAWRLGTTIVGAFGIVAILLAALGVYGVSSHATESRRRELCIRKTLGASDRRVMRLVLGESVGVALGGAAVGLGASLIGSHLTRHLAFGVTMLDPRLLVVPIVTLVVVTVAATLAPAWRAASINPAIVLRSE